MRLIAVDLQGVAQSERLVDLIQLNGYVLELLPLRRLVRQLLFVRTEPNLIYFSVTKSNLYMPNLIEKKKCAIVQKIINHIR